MTLIYRYAQKFVKNKLINLDKADILTFHQRQTLIIFTDRLLRIFLDMSCVNSQKRPKSKVIFQTSGTVTQK